MPTVEDIIAKYENAPLECDGMTRILYSEFMRAGYQCEPWMGALFIGKKYITPHLWVVLADGRHVDVRARMYLGNDPIVPHGVFQPSDKVKYNGYPIELGIMPSFLVQALITPVPPDLIARLAAMCSKTALDDSKNSK